MLNSKDTAFFEEIEQRYSEIEEDSWIKGSESKCNWEEMIEAIKRRGPDCFRLLRLDSEPVEVETIEEEGTYLGSSVLSIREMQEQPVVSKESIIAYNGEIFSKTGSDTILVKDALDSVEFNGEIESYTGKIFEKLNQLEGDFSFVYVTKEIAVIGRDLFGKRSLTIGFDRENSRFVFSSVIPKSFESLETVEMPSNCLLVLNRVDSTFRLINNKISPFSLRFGLSPNVSTDNIKEKVFETFKKAVKKRLLSYNSVEKGNVVVLFSGGVDSTLLAYTVLEILPSVKLDLVNLSFMGEDAPDRKSSLVAFSELTQIFPDSEIRLLLADKSFEDDIEKNREAMLSLIYPKSTHMDFNVGSSLHFASKCKGYVLSASSGSKIFDNLEIDNDLKLDKNNDILTKRIKTIDYKPFIEGEAQSDSKIVFSGLGADEVFGGYSRYRVAHQRAGNQAVLSEMAKDVSRLWFRNFSRDDKVISDNGVEARFPFLDTDLLFLLASVPLESLSDFSLPRGQGEKFILRQILLEKGLKYCFKQVIKRF